MNKKGILYLLLFILLVGFLLRLNNLSGRSLWTDEFFTIFESTGHGVEANSLLNRLSKSDSVELLRTGDFKLYLENNPSKNIGDVTRGVFNTDTHPPFYFWIMNVWMKVFGENIFIIRLFSILMGLFAIVLAYQVGTYLFNISVGSFCALFVSISAFSVRYSQEARAYSLVLVLGLLSWLFVLRLEKHNRNQDAFWFAVVNSLGLYTHYFYAFIALAQFVYFSLVYRNDAGKINRFYLAFLFSLLVLSSWFILVILNGYNFRNIEWIFGYPGLIEKVLSLCFGILRYFYMFDRVNQIQGVFLLACLCVFIILTYRVFKESVKKYSRQLFFCLVMFLTPLLFMFLIDIFQHGALLKQERFWMFSFLGFIPLMGYFLNYAYSKSRVIAFFIALLLLLFSVLSNKIQFGPAPWQASDWINHESSGKSSAVFIYNIRSAVFAQAYYLNNDIYLIPVSNIVQFKNGINKVNNYVERIFIVRHYHHSDASLMTPFFMEVRDIDSGFKFIQEIKKDDVSVSEYEKCA